MTGPIKVRIRSTCNARQVDNTNAGELAKWCFGNMRGGPRGGSKGGCVIWDHPGAGRQIAQPGDWIVETDRGEFLRYDEALFERVYEPVPADEPSVQVTRDLLSLVEDEFPAPMPTLEEIAAWPMWTRQWVVAWAGAVHLVASDNDVPIPAMPDVLLADVIRIPAPSDPADIALGERFDELDPEDDGNDWPRLVAEARAAGWVPGEGALDDEALANELAVKWEYSPYDDDSWACVWVIRSAGWAPSPEATS